MGGKGSIIGTLLGAIILGAMRNGLTLLNVQAFYQLLATGLIILVAMLSIAPREDVVSPQSEDRAEMTNAVVVVGSLHYDIMVDAPDRPRKGETVPGPAGRQVRRQGRQSGDRRP